MTHARLQQFILACLCALALIAIPMSGSAVWAQGHQNDRNQDLKTDSQPNFDQNSDINREKPSSNAETQTPPTQNGQRESSQSTGVNQNPDQNRELNNQNQSPDQNDVNSATSLPRTAGDLPLLALIGVLSLVAAAGTRLAVRSNR